MDVASVALVVAALGVSFGWQPSPEDPQAYEVLMQVEPELVDVLQDGRQIPIESHVPASVIPIRNIRVVVGTDELPRTPIADKRGAKPQTDRIVRGQEESLVPHTARFQGDDGWTGDRYAPATTSGTRQYDQRGATIGVDPIRTAQNSPWTLDGAKQAATDTGNALRDSVNSGIQQANQQFSQGGQQLIDSAQNAGSKFGQQLQEMSGFGGQTAPPSTASSASRSSQSSWPAPPPLASSSTNSATTPATWSSIKPQLAPPRLPTPSLPNSTRVASNPATSRSSGPTFPPPPTSSQPLHSVLADPAASSSRTGGQDWASVWGTSSTTGTGSTANDSDAGVGLVPVPPRVRAPSSPQTAASDPDAARWAWPTPSSSPTSVTANSSPAQPQLDDRYPQSAPATSAGTNNAADLWANFGSPQDAGSGSQPDRLASQSQPAPATITQNPPITNTQPAIGTQPPVNQSQAGQQPARTEEVPWKPLLAVSLALAGSLGANVFLGMSYADARHRYHAMVAKTTHTFQKAAGLAA